MKIAVYIGAVLAVLIVVLTFMGGSSAVQEAAGCALALCCVVIPYSIVATSQRAAMLDLTRRNRLGD